MANVRYSLAIRPAPLSLSTPPCGWTRITRISRCNFSPMRASPLANTSRRSLRSSNGSQRNPQSETAYALLASCYGHLGRPEDCRRAWEQALRINPAFSIERRRRVHLTGTPKISSVVSKAAQGGASELVGPSGALKLIEVMRTASSARFLRQGFPAAASNTLWRPSMSWSSQTIGERVFHAFDHPFHCQQPYGGEVGEKRHEAGLDRRMIATLVLVPSEFLSRASQDEIVERPDAREVLRVKVNRIRDWRSVHGGRRAESHRGAARRSLPIRG